MTPRAPGAPPQRWVRALLERAIISKPGDVRFAAFSLGEMANAVMHGTAISPNNPVGYRLAPRRRADGCAPIAIASRRSAVVVVTGDELLVVAARTGYTRLRGPVTAAPLSDVRYVVAAGGDLGLSLRDGSTASFSFARVDIAAAFVALW